MLAQRLRHRVQVDELIVTQNPITGAQIETWQAFLADEPAEIGPLTASSREQIAANAIQATVNTQIVMRLHPGLKPSMRVVHEGVVYDIHAIVPDRKLRQFVTMLCDEGANDG